MRAESVLRNSSETARPSKASTVALVWLATVLIVGLNVGLTWTGYVESDDWLYAGAAKGWIDAPPFLGPSHWAIRHLIVLPIAAAFAAGGRSEAMLLLPTTAYFVVLLALLAYITNRVAGAIAAALTVALAGTIPVLATGASVVSTDIPEALFIIGSLWLFFDASRAPRTWKLIVCGMSAGCALITRETTVALLLLYGLFFALRYGTPRVRYLWIALGLLGVTGADWLYLTALSGDPLYRPHISLAGAQSDGPQMEGVFAKAPGVDRFGGLDVRRSIRPIVSLLLNQNFGAFFWLAVPATIWLSFAVKSLSRDSSRLFGFLALTWLLIVGYGLAPWLWVIPRYYVVGVVLAIPLSIAVIRLARVRPRLAAAVCFGLIGSNTLLNTAATSDIMAGERALVVAARSSPEVVYTDPATGRGARWLLDSEGLSGRVRVDLPPAGALYLFNGKPRRSLPDDWPIRQPGTGWTSVSEFRVPEKWTGPFSRALGLRRILPPGLYDKLDPPPHLVAEYRLPGL